MILVGSQSTNCGTGTFGVGRMNADDTEKELDERDQLFDCDTTECASTTPFTRLSPHMSDFVHKVC